MNKENIFIRNKGKAIFILSITVIVIFFIIADKEKVKTQTVNIYYVSEKGNDDFSGRLDSPNFSRNDGPFRTIEKAKQVVREKIRWGMNSEITIIIRGGEYCIDSTLEFNHEDSGRNGFSVIYKSYPNEEVILNGGYYIKEWEKYKGNIYKTNVGRNVFSTMYENDKRVVKARYPNEGYKSVNKLVEYNPNLMFNFIKDDIPPTSIIQDIEVCIWPGGPKGEWSWIIENKSVKEIDYSNGIITLNEGTTYEIGKGSRYYVQGVLEYLDSPGEFYLDKKNGDLYYWPISLPINDQKICIPKLNKIIQLEDYGEDKAVSNIIFEGITLINTDISNDFNNSFDSALIFLGYNSKNITIKDCKLHNSGDNGIMLFTKAESNTIYGNDIFNIGRNGVFLEGGMDSIKYINKNNKIMNNHIYNIGEIIGHGKGISLHNSGDNIISHNRIHNVPRSGINITSSIAGSIIGKTIDGIFVTKENAKQFAHSRNNVIEYNDISNCAEDSEDVGLIYFWGVGTGNVINNNYLHDSDVPFSFAAGIYLDDGSNDVTVTNNLITRLQNKNKNGVLTSALYVKGVGNNIINNIVVDNDERSSALRTFEMAGEPNNNLIIERNIFCNSGEYIFSFTNWSDERFKFSDYNIIYNKNKNYILNGVPYIKTFSEWKNILKSKYDQHSIISEPLFMDEEKGDYRLRYDSPAYILGFNDINYEDIGLLNDFEYADRDEEIDRLFIRYNDDIFKSYIKLKQGEQGNLQVLVRTINGYKIDFNIKNTTMFSSNNKIASVNSKGVVQGKSKGIAKITVVTKDKTHKKSDISIIVY